MADVLLTCVHCDGVKVGFTIVADYQSTKERKKRKFICLGICGSCESGAVLEFTAPPANIQDQKKGLPRSPREAKADPVHFGFELLKTYPLPEPPKVPSHSSDELKRFFTQAANALKRGDWDASGAMSRKVVDVSTQQLLGGEAKKFGTIEKRIDQLAKTGQITTDLQEWAHQIRLGGNEASHEETPYTEPEAAELLDFADLYLTYVYTLPGRLKDRKERAAAKKKAAEDAATPKTKAAGEVAVPA